MLNVGMLRILMLILADCHYSGYCNAECSYSDVLLSVFMLIAVDCHDSGYCNAEGSYTDVLLS